MQTSLPNKPLEWTGPQDLSAAPPKAPCLPLRGSVRRILCRNPSGQACEEPTTLPSLFETQMKKGIQQLLASFGYRISRLPAPAYGEDSITAIREDSITAMREDPFTAMQHLLIGIKQPIIFDVGAHHGHISRHFRSLFPTSTVYSFEPFQDSFEQLKANTASDPGIKVLTLDWAIGMELNLSIQIQVQQPIRHLQLMNWAH